MKRDEDPKREAPAKGKALPGFGDARSPRTRPAAADETVPTPHLAGVLTRVQSIVK